MSELGSVRRAVSFVPIRRGTVVVALLIAMVIVGLVVTAMVVSGARDQDLAVQRVGAARSQYAAEAATNMALREVALNTDIDADGAIGSISNDGNAANDPALGASRLNAVATTAGGQITIDVTGTSHLSQRETRAVLTPASSGASPAWPGLFVEWFNLTTGPTQLAHVDWNATPSAIGLVPDISMPSATGVRYSGGQTNNWGARFTGSINIPTGGTWTFWTESDDGSDLSIDGVRVVNNDGLHSMVSASGAVSLTAGWHSITARFFERNGNHGMIVSWSGPGFASRTVIPRRYLRCSPSDLPMAAFNGTIVIDGDGTGSAAYIDAFNATTGAYGGSNILLSAAIASTNSTSAGAMAMSQQARLSGSARGGPGGNPSSVITTSSGATISGTRTALPQRIAILTPRPSSTPSSSGDLVVSSNQTWSTSRRHTKVELTGASTVVTVSGHISFVVDTTFEVKDGSRINIGADSSLTVYAADTIAFSSDARVNTNTGNPDNVVFVGTSSSARDFMLTDRAQVVAHVWNPTGAVRLHGSSPGSQLHGLIYANSLNITDTSALHVPTYTGSGGGVTTYRVSAWSEQP